MGKEQLLGELVLVGQEGGLAPALPEGRKASSPWVLTRVVRVPLLDSKGKGVVQVGEKGVNKVLKGKSQLQWGPSSHNGES